MVERRPLRLGRWLLAAGVALGLSGCDWLAFQRLEPGVSTEADVTRYLGAPVQVWNEDDGARTLEYPRQPAGVRNYMITIAPDGRLRAIRQVLTPENFARIRPGMDADAVRRILGEPARRIPYRLQRQIIWTWRYDDPPLGTRAFNVMFDMSLHVINAATGPDPDGPDSVGGG